MKLKIFYNQCYGSKRTEFKYVSKVEYKGDQTDLRDKGVFMANIPNFRWTNFFDDKREAAKAVDIKLIEKGKKPVNILKSVL